MVARERLVPDRRRGRSACSRFSATAVFRVPGPAGSEAAAALYTSPCSEAVEGDDSAKRTTLFAQLQADYPDSAYTHQAAMLIGERPLVTAPDRPRPKLRT